MADRRWRLKGEYFESCNCEILCPCIVRGTTVIPTEGHCDVALAFHIDDGELDASAVGRSELCGLQLHPGGPWVTAAGLRQSTSTSGPPRSSVKPWKDILSGDMGGAGGTMAGDEPPTLWESAYVPIDFRVDGRVHSVSVPGHNGL